MRILILTLLALPLTAQNSDLGFLFGASPQKTEIRNGVIRTSTEGSMQINYAWQFREGPAGRLYVEMPILFVGGSRAEVGTAVFARSGGSGFYIPGIRYQYNFTPRVALYVAGGAGFEYRHTQLGMVSGRFINSENHHRLELAADAGAGFDFRLNRLWSLRGEVRDFISAYDFGFGQRHNVNVQFGFALHF